MSRWRPRSGRQESTADLTPPADAPTPVDEHAPVDDLAPVAGAETAQGSRASIDAVDVEAVLRRAVELASDQLLAPESFSVRSLQEVAAELHLPVTAMADALAEYRAGAIDRPLDALGGHGGRRKGRGRWRGLVDRLVGPGVVSVKHRTGLSDEDVIENLSEWLDRHHRLRIRVTPDGTVVGSRRRGAMASVDLAMSNAFGGAGLAKMREVRGAAVPVEPGLTSICLVVDLTDQRNESLIGGSVLAVTGAATVTTAAVVVAPVAFAGVPVVVGAGWLLSRLVHRSSLRRTIEELEFTADNVAAGALPTSKLDSLTRGKARRLLNRSSRSSRTSRPSSR